MDHKLSITVLYDDAEDVEKAKADAAGKPFPLAYAQVADALEKRGHKVQTVAVTKRIRNLVALVEKDNSDVIFNLCEAIASSAQHEHNVVGLLELFEKCFTGCGSAGWLLASDKALCKKLFQFHGIRYPRFCTFEQGKVEWADALDFPMIVKPLNEDASIGIDHGSVVHNVKDLLERISYIHDEFQGASLVEEYIEGREIYVGVLGNGKPEAFPILEWDFSKLKDVPKIAGTEAKWDPQSEAYKAPEIFPDDIPPDVVRGIQNTAITAYQALELSGYARVDMRLRGRKKSEVAAAEKENKGDKKADRPMHAGKHENPATRSSAPGHSSEWDYPIIEVNPNCWLEKRSQFAAAGRKHGLSYPDLLERIIELALARRAPEKK